MHIFFFIVNISSKIFCIKKCKVLGNSVAYYVIHICVPNSWNMSLSYAITQIYQLFGTQIWIAKYKNPKSNYSVDLILMVVLRTRGWPFKLTNCLPVPDKWGDPPSNQISGYSLINFSRASQIKHGLSGSSWGLVSMHFIVCVCVLIFHAAYKLESLLWS